MDYSAYNPRFRAVRYEVKLPSGKSEYIDSPSTTSEEITKWKEKASINPEISVRLECEIYDAWSFNLCRWVTRYKYLEQPRG